MTCRALLTRDHQQQQQPQQQQQHSTEERVGGTPHANTTHFPNDESLELELGTGPKPSIAEVLDRGGAAVEREGAYPVPSPRGTLPTWTPSGDDLNLVHNRRSSLVQARISGIFFSGAVSCVSDPRLLHLHFCLYPPLPRPGWFFVPIRSVTNHKSI